MNEHETIRGLLALAAAGALTNAEEERVTTHIRSCLACFDELEEWRSIAGRIRQLPTPQPAPRLAQLALARAEARLAEQAEESWNRGLMTFVVAFAWLLTAVSWPLFHLLSRLLAFLDPQLSRTWISLAGFTALLWVAGGTAAVLLALRQRRERRLV
jgi:hypothetical protein